MILLINFKAYSTLVFAFDRKYSIYKHGKLESYPLREGRLDEVVL